VGDSIAKIAELEILYNEEITLAVRYPYSATLQSASNAYKSPFNNASKGEFPSFLQIKGRYVFYPQTSCAIA
jgi:hypothetical protein